MTDIYNSGIPAKILFAGYLGMIFVSVFVSISLPIDRYDVEIGGVGSAAMSVTINQATAEITPFLY